MRVFSFIIYFTTIGLVCNENEIRVSASPKGVLAI